MSVIGLSSVAANSGVFPNTHVGSGSNGHCTKGMGLEATPATDAEVHCQRTMGPLPTGTPVLRLQRIANATSGQVDVEVFVGSSNEGDLSSLTLVSKGTQNYSWGAGDNDKMLQETVALTGDLPVADETYVVHLVFKSTTTLTEVSTWIAELVYS